MNKINKNIWGQFPLEVNKLMKIKIADLTLYLMLLKKDIKIAYVYTNDKTSSYIIKKTNEPLDWKRWPLKGELTNIKISPALPDRPLLVKSESALNLPVNFESLVYIRFPVSIKITTIYKNKSEDLIELPTVKLSNTWFGSFKEGEVCYSLSSGIRTEIEPDSKRPFMAICPFTLKNKADEHLEIDRICLRSDYLSLFQDETQLWTDELAITYKGKHEISQVLFSGKKPVSAGKCIMVTEPRTVLKKSLNASSFSTIKDLAGAGLFSAK